MFLLRQGNRTDYNYKEYYLDSADELSQVPKNECCPGSIAYVVANGQVYMLNGQREWVLQ